MAAISYKTELQLAAGFNNIAGLTLITEILDADSIPIALPTPFEGFSLGIRKPLLSRAMDTLESQTRAWTFSPALAYKQRRYLFNTYEAQNNAQVTVRTINEDGTFSNYNALIIVPTDINQGDMLNNSTGYGTRTPGNYTANYLNTVIAFSIEGIAS